MDEFVEARGSKRRMALCAVMGGLLAIQTIAGGGVALAASDQRALPKRFGVTARGDMRLIGNTTLTCRATPSYAASCADAQAGAGSGLNDKFNMVWVDEDGDPATFNASRATLSIPEGATVAFAGLYWGGNLTAGIGGRGAPNVAANTSVLFKTPGGAYAPVTGGLVGTDDTTGQSRSYGVFADVTAQVRGSGEYWVGNVQSGTGIRDDAGASGGLFAGWGLIVIFTDDRLPLRNFNVWDAFFRVAENTTGRVAVNDFVTPLVGRVGANIGTIVFEGDLGLPGDSLRLQSAAVSDARNPATNVFNGTSSAFGAPTPRLPMFVNMLGIDVDTLDVDGVLANGATAAEVQLPTTADNYFPAMLALAIDVYEPKLEMAKSFVDVNGGDVVPGDILRYTVVMTNTGVDTATKVLMNDPIPAGTRYLQGSLRVVENPGGDIGQKTDALDADIAMFDGVANRTIFKLGDGATAAQGGSIPVGARAIVEFCVTIDAAIPDASRLRNVATTTYSGSVISATYTLTAEASVDTLVFVPDLSVTKTDGGRTAAPGERVVYRIFARNESGHTTGRQVVLTETLPLYTSFTGPDSWRNVPGTRLYARDIGVLGPSQSRVVTFGIKIDDTVPLTVTALDNIVLIGDNAAPMPERNTDNNTGRDDTLLIYADIEAVKNDSLTSTRIGDYLSYVFTVTNKGPSRADRVQISDPLFKGMIQPTWTCTAGPGGACGALSGTGPLSSTADLAAGGYVVYRINVLVGLCDGLLINRATAFAPNIKDPTPGNNIALDINHDGDGANLFTMPSLSPMIPGEPATIVIPVVNYGPDAAVGVTMSYKLPPGFTLTSSIISGTLTGTVYDPLTDVWQIGAMPVGSALTLTLSGMVTETLIVGTVLTSVLNLDTPSVGNAPIRQHITTTVEPIAIIAGPQLLQFWMPLMARQ